MAVDAELELRQEQHARELIEHGAGFIPKGMLATDRVLAYWLGISPASLRKEYGDKAVSRIGKRLIFDTDRL
jgi:hypothetical protein